MESLIPKDRPCEEYSPYSPSPHGQARHKHIEALHSEAQNFLPVPWRLQVSQRQTPFHLIGCVGREPNKGASHEQHHSSTILPKSGPPLRPHSTIRTTPDYRTSPYYPRYPRFSNSLTGYREVANSLGNFCFGSLPARAAEETRRLPPIPPTSPRMRPSSCFLRCYERSIWA